MLASALLLRNWHEQRPSNHSDLDSSVTGEVGIVYYTGVDVHLILFLYRSTRLLLGCVLNSTPCPLTNVTAKEMEIYGQCSCPAYNFIR
jgi:hypothetical protein